MKNSVAVSGFSKTFSLIGCREIAKAFGIWIDFIGLQVEQKLARSVAGYKDTKGTHGIWETLGSVVSGRVFALFGNSVELGRLIGRAKTPKVGLIYGDTKGTHGNWETLGSVVSGRVFDIARNSEELARSSAAGRLQSLSGYG